VAESYQLTPVVAPCLMKEGEQTFINGFSNRHARPVMVAFYAFILASL
jgi:hypothetical protein